jgi:hypothetical protein
MRKTISIILFLLISINSFSQNNKGLQNGTMSDTLKPVWPIPLGSPPPPINMEGKRLRCYGKNNKGAKCPNNTTSITGLCKKHEPKFKPPKIMTN